MSDVGRTLQKVAAAPLIGLIVVYQQVFFPLRPPPCRYYPSCSAYALTAARRVGTPLSPRR